MAPVNAYTPLWFDLFMNAIDGRQTARETDFLSSHLPLPACRRVLDLCCGSGRHSHALALRGYEVVGLDRDRAALARASAEAPPGCTFVEGDMREPSAAGNQFDAVVCLWQSFGYFDHDGNRAVLQGIHDALRAGGVVILDVYHHDFFKNRQGTQTFQRGDLAVEEQKVMRSGRLHVTLTYRTPGAQTPDSPADRFEWTLYTPRTLSDLLADSGFQAQLICRDFNGALPASPDVPRMQIVAVRA